MKTRLSLAVTLLLAPFHGGLSAQDLGSLAVFVGNPNQGNAAAEAAFQARCADARRAIGQGQTLLMGFVDYKQPLGSSWLNDASWFRGSMVASGAVKHMVPIYSVGLADAVTTDPIGQMLAIGNPQDTVYGPVFQSLINGFRSSGFSRLYLRIGWEHNGEWYPWATTQPYKTFNPERTAAFLAAWRRVADLAHNTPGITVLTVWSPNFERLTPPEIAATYPGDQYVDVIAPDIYSPIWNAIPENWDPAIGGTSPESVWKANLVNRQHTWDYPMATMSDPTAGYGLVAMMQFALERNKPFGLGETGTDGGVSSGIDRGPEDRGDFPLYLAKRISEKMAQGLKFAYLGLWDDKNFRFTRGARPADTAGWVTLVNLLAGADPVQVEDIAAPTATDAVTLVADVGATGNYVPDPTRAYVREQDIGGEVSVLNANAANDYIQYVVPVADAGVYHVKLRVKVGPTRGTCRLVIDGLNQGTVQDFYAATDAYVVVDFGRKGFPTPGNKTFRLVVAGKSSGSSGYTLAVDYIDLNPDRREAELLANGTLTDGTTVFREVAASNDAAERFDANAVGDVIEYLVPVVEPGSYSVRVRVKKYQERGIFQLAISSVAQGGVHDLYAPAGQANPYTVLDLGTKSFSRVGDKTFRFTVTGRNASSSGYKLAFDYLELSPTQQRYEAEALQHGAQTDGTTILSETAASGGAGERLDSNAVGDFIEYRVPVIEPGTYSVKVRVKRHSSRGRFQLRIGGTNQGGVQEQYAATAAYAELNLGTKSFAGAGEHVFRFTVVGKHASSSGYSLAFDSILLTRQ